MQRWWFMDNTSKLPDNTPIVPVESPVEEEVVEKLRQWTFRVFVAQDLLPFEAIAVAGETCALGKWNPKRCVPLTKETGEDNIWSVTTIVPDEMHIRYRYFIYSKDPCTNHMHIRRWETHLEPRQIPAFTDGPTADLDTFGDVNGVEKRDCGWLTNETVFQFKFFNNPFHFKQKLKNRLIYVKLTPMNLRITDTTTSHIAASDDSLSNEPSANTCGEKQSSYALAEVVTIKSPQGPIAGQAQFGQAYHENDMIIFHVTVTEPDNIAYLIDLYTYSSRQDKDEPPIHLGYHYILPNVLRQSDGELEIPITCATNHRPLGMMNVEFLKITALKTNTLSMKHSYIRYWNPKWSGLEVGHRGSGVSFKGEGTTIRENTIASLKKAAACGADMVEFDIQLSKDLVPVIYHDYIVYVSLKKKNQLHENDMLQLPMKELTFEQLSNLKVYHAVEGRTGTARFFDEDLDEHQPFPKLADALDIIDISVGFNIEVKWSMRRKDGSLELDSSIDRNLYVDRILDVVLEKAGQRRIVFSCFDPDVCTMLRYKQNLYPVMFLTQGITERYPQYHDPRCNSIESAVSNAYAMELLGIVAHTEDLLRDPTQVNLATDLDLVVFCWGDDNNSACTIQMLKDLGIHGIIYDKMDVLSTKEIKQSIFLVDSAPNTHTDLLRLQKLEGVRVKNGHDAELTGAPTGQVLHLLEERTKLSLSTATSAESLFLDDPDDEAAPPAECL